MFLHLQLSTPTLNLLAKISANPVSNPRCGFIERRCRDSERGWRCRTPLRKVFATQATSECESYRYQEVISTDRYQIVSIRFSGITRNFARHDSPENTSDHSQQSRPAFRYVHSREGVVMMNVFFAFLSANCREWWYMKNVLFRSFSTVNVVFQIIYYFIGRVREKSSEKK